MTKRRAPGGRNTSPAGLHTRKERGSNMGLFLGNASFRRYVVDGECGDVNMDLAFRRYSWRPIDDDRGERESFGWVDPFDPRGRGNIEISKQQYAGKIFLGVRHDVKSVPPVLFKAERDAAFEAAKREKGVQRLSRQQRLGIEESVMLSMLKHVSPKTKMIEVVWDTANGDFFIGSTSASICDRIAELIKSTFDIKLLLSVPGVNRRESEISDVVAAIGEMERFLSWLSDRCVESPTGVAECEQAPDHMASVMGPMVFSGESETAEIVGLKGADPVVSEEATAARGENKALVKSRICMSSSEIEWTFSFDVRLPFNISSMKLKMPKEMLGAMEMASIRLTAIRDLVDWLDVAMSEFLSKQQP